MRYILMLLVLGLIGWGAYWLLGARQLDKELTNWFAQRRAENWQAEYQDLHVRGFPYRFEASFTNPALADPQSGLAWEAPFFQFQMLSYKPNHIIAVWPAEQMLATPLANFDIKSDDMRASLMVKPRLDLRLDSTTLTAEALKITQRVPKQTTSIDKLSLAAKLTGEGAEPSYHLGLAASDVALSDGWLRLLDPDNQMPKKLAGFKADLTVTFDRYWDQSSLDQVRPQPRLIHIKLAEARWGELLLQATGTLQVDEMGVPKGEITVKADNWREILQMARLSGQLTEGLANLIETGLTYLAELSGNSRNLDVPLTFKNGLCKIGPLPIAPAPILRLR